jgi:hypothetical protein
LSKDQTLGAAILVVCVIVAVGYVVGLFFYPYVVSWVNVGSVEAVRFWLIAVPVAVAFVAILAIGAWVGYTMATTPSPKPIEEISTEPPTEASTPTSA